MGLPSRISRGGAGSRYPGRPAASRHSRLRPATAARRSCTRHRNSKVRLHQLLQDTQAGYVGFTGRRRLACPPPGCAGRNPLGPQGRGSVLAGGNRQWGRKANAQCLGRKGQWDRKRESHSVLAGKGSGTARQRHSVSPRHSSRRGRTCSTAQPCSRKGFSLWSNGSGNATQGCVSRSEVQAQAVFGKERQCRKESSVRRDRTPCSSQLRPPPARRPAQ